jgi:hypothetical protein
MSNNTTNLVGSPILTRVDTEQGTPEFDSFRSLAAKLVQVPKPEVDEKRDERN